MPSVPHPGAADPAVPKSAGIGAMPFAGARINHGELSRIARDVFGLTRPVQLSRRYMRGYWGRAASWPWLHKISLSTDHGTIEAACRTLAHELTHCVQAESMPHMEWVNSARAEHLMPYDERPIEVEANEWAEAFWAELLPAIRRSEDA